MRVVVPMATGFEEIETLTIIDVLRRGGVAVASAALGGELRVVGSKGVAVEADYLWDQLDSSSYTGIVLPGGGVGTENLMADERVLEMVREFDAEEKIVAAICAAPMVLAKAGILEGCRATCYPSCAEALGESYDDVPVIADGNIITSQGPATAMLFSLVVLQHLAGEDCAQRVAAGLLFDF